MFGGLLNWSRKAFTSAQNILYKENGLVCLNDRHFVQMLDNRVVHIYECKRLYIYPAVTIDILRSYLVMGYLLVNHNVSAESLSHLLTYSSIKLPKDNKGLQVEGVDIKHVRYSYCRSDKRGLHHLFRTLRSMLNAVMLENENKSYS